MNTPERDYVTFDDCYAMSCGASKDAIIEQVLLNAVPGATAIRKATKHEDKAGTDWWVKLVSGRVLSVDLKYRPKDYSQIPPPKGGDDLALEIWSVPGKKVGWTRDHTKRTDYILWWWNDTGRHCLVPFPMLCQVFTKFWEQWEAEYGKRDNKTTVMGTCRYRSAWIAVPRKVVWRAIYLEFAGNPVTSVSSPRGNS